MFRDLYDQTSARAQRALYAWLAGALQKISNATGEPAGARSGGGHPDGQVLHLRAGNPICVTQRGACPSPGSGKGVARCKAPPVCSLRRVRAGLPRGLVSYCT